MRLDALLDMELPPGQNVEIGGITADSRDVSPGDLFIAYRGGAADGHDFVAEAVSRGAAAVCCEREPGSDPGVPVIVVPGVAARISAIAARFFDDPSRDLDCIGVTGTNGKTSIAYFCASLLDSTGFIGTIGWGDPEDLQPADMTTADPIAMQQRLAELRGAGMTAAAMEVSSHALDQGRVDAVAFDVAVFSNLTRDHLDYHGSMARYGAAKRSLFERPELKTAIINADDAFGRELLVGVARDGLDCISYGATDADVTWDDVRYQPEGITGTWSSPWGKAAFHLPLYGAFSVANAAAALATVVTLGEPLTECVERMRGLPGVPGRMQIIRGAGTPVVIVDYAHTPDALAAVLKASRAHLDGKLFCVFGCGGDRDTGKRPLMAAAVEENADVAVVTSDNPRSEDPQAIVADVVAGFRGSDFRIEVDRAKAIREAITEARAGDVVMVAGRGHETYQEVAGIRHPFDDVEVVRSAMGVAQ